MQIWAKVNNVTVKLKALHINEIYENEKIVVYKTQFVHRNID